MTIPTATGSRHERNGEPYVVLTRTFSAPIEDVWAAITESDRLARWIGRWTGDPASGRIDFTMLYEDDDFTETYTIDECVEPRRLALTSHTPLDDETPMTWHLELDLTEEDGVTTLTFAQNLTDPAMAENIGPGWEYYLDRMVVAETAGDPSTIDFADYYPALGAHYRAQFAAGE